MASEWAIEEGRKLQTHASPNGSWMGLSTESVATALDAAVERGRREERETCATLVDEMAQRALTVAENNRPDGTVHWAALGEYDRAKSVFAAIRARDAKPGEPVGKGGG